MKTIEISVDDQDFSKLKNLLIQLDFVKQIKEKQAAEIDATTLLSEQSLAEEWDSIEDSRYEQYFQKWVTVKAILYGLISPLQTVFNQSRGQL